MAEISVVILNYKRPLNLTDHILPAYAEYGVVREVLVVDNSPNGTAPLFAKSNKVNIIKGNREFGLDVRFAAALLSRTQRTLIQDDDVLLPEETIKELERASWHEPKRLHGLFGRNPTSDNKYANFVERRHDEADMLTTRALIGWEMYFGHFFTGRHRAPVGSIRRLAPASVHRENGEDIIFSYAVRAVTGKRHHVHNLPFTALPEGDVAISRNMGAHLSFRTEIMRACQQAFFV